MALAQHAKHGSQAHPSTQQEAAKPQYCSHPIPCHSTQLMLAPEGALGYCMCAQVAGSTKHSGLRGRLGGLEPPTSRGAQSPVLICVSLRYSSPLV